MIYKALENITYSEEDGWKFHCRNILTGKPTEFVVGFGLPTDPREDAQDWANGKLVQNAFRYLYPAEREMLITGMLPDEWENMDDLGE